MSLKKIKGDGRLGIFGVPLMSQSLIYHPKLTRNIVSLLLVMHAIKFPNFLRKKLITPMSIYNFLNDEDKNNP
jgi:hypothetical protein